MLTRLKGGRLYDPAHQVDGATGDIWIENGRIVAKPANGAKPDVDHDITGMVVMAGGIDIHSHIGGGKVNLARALMLEDHETYKHAPQDGLRAGSGVATPSTFSTGYRYAQMGYTAAFEPAVVISNARHAHLEMSDIPMIDKGGYLMLGNDDILLQMLASKREQSAVNDYVALMVQATGCIGVKIVNPGGISAFKFNQRNLGLDEDTAFYHLNPHRIVQSLAQAVHDIGLVHPLHIHCNNLGVPGNFQTTLDTVRAVEGLPIHLTHVQFHSYGAEGDRHFSSAAAHIAEMVNATPNVNVDEGQSMFGQTVTASGDTMTQFRNAGFGDPKKSICMDIECDGGCGLVPFNYKDKNFVNALQWTIGLELFLLVNDPWRIFLTTDHPNGAPFTTYPHLIRLLMDKTFRNEKLAGINKHAAAASTLGSIDREYSLYEIAILTRAGPSRILGLKDRGHLGEGAAADIAVYAPHANAETMFDTPKLVFKDGELVVRDGQIVKTVWGATHVAQCDFGHSIEKEVEKWFATWKGTRFSNFVLSKDELEADGRSRWVGHNLARRS